MSHLGRCVDDDDRARVFKQMLVQPSIASVPARWGTKSRETLGVVRPIQFASCDVIHVCDRKLPEGNWMATEAEEAEEHGMRGRSFLVLVACWQDDEEEISFSPLVRVRPARGQELTVAVAETKLCSFLVRRTCRGGMVKFGKAEARRCDADRGRARKGNRNCLQASRS